MPRRFSLLTAVTLAVLAIPGPPRVAFPQDPGPGPERPGRRTDGAAFDPLQSADAESAASHYERGMALAGALNYSGAIAALERAVAIDPGHAPAWRQLVLLYPQIARKDRARLAYREARASGAIPETERLPLARALRKAGWLKEARELLEALPANARTPEQEQELGLAAAEAGDQEAAAAHLARGTSDPALSSAEAEHAYGAALEALGRPSEAIERYRRAMALDPRHRAARFRLGTLLLRGGQQEEGRALLRGYEQLRQWDRRVKLLLFMVTSGKLSGAEEREKTLQLVDFLLQGDALETAGPLIASYLARHPDDEGFLTAHARWLLASGQAATARQALSPLLARATPPLDALWLAARIDLVSRRPAEAVESLERVLARDAQPPARLLQELATGYALLGRTSEAETNFTRALAADPKLAAAHADLGLLLESLGRLAEAEQHLRSALQIDPDLVPAQQALAGLLLRSDRVAEAAGLLEASVWLRPGDGTLRLKLADVLERIGRREEAATQRRIGRETLARRPPGPG